MDILLLVQTILSNRMTLFVLALLITNLVTGLLVAILPHTNETFTLGQVGNWMVRALAYVFGAVCVQVLGYYATAGYEAIFQPLSTVCWGFVLLSLAGKVLQNLRDLGFNIPEVLGDKPKASIV
jgi:hypothetical protein